MDFPIPKRTAEAEGAHRSDPLWRAISTMRIEPEGAKLTFAARLARENGWKLAHAEAVLGEYRKFLYLAATAPTPLTPSDEVDQAWHLHLAYTRHYWDELCGKLLKQPLHHGPTSGGEEERSRYRRQYRETLLLYRSTFGTDPPADIWPTTAMKAPARYVRVDASRYWLLPRASLAAGALTAGASSLAACALLGDDAGRRGGIEIATILVVFMLLLVLPCALIAAANARHRRGRSQGDGGSGGVSYDGRDSDPDGAGDAGCGGGCGGD